MSRAMLLVLALVFMAGCQHTTGRVVEIAGKTVRTSTGFVVDVVSPVPIMVGDSVLIREPWSGRDDGKWQLERLWR